MNEPRLRDALRDRPAPGEDAAQERAWRVVRAGFPAPRDQQDRRPRRLALALAAATVVLALAVTGPGEAVADWVRDTIGREHSAAHPLTSLPSGGRLLVQSANGPWVVAADGSKRRLGSYGDASWSPRGLFVAATRPDELVTMDPKGNVRWSLARTGGVGQPRWSPDGFRIAYRGGDGIRIVAGDGTGDLPLGISAHTAPAWRPGSRHVLAYVEPKGDVHVVDTDSGRSLWRAFPGPPPADLLWSADGSRLLALAPRNLRVYDDSGQLVGSRDLPPGARAEAAAFAVSGNAFALASYTAAAGRSRITLVRADGKLRERRLFSGAGRFGPLAWSPDGQWLLLSWRTADQWLFINVPNGTGPLGKVVAFSSISRQFRSGIDTQLSFPAVAGWCCPH